FYDATSQEPALAARQLNRHLLLLLQQGCLPLSGINNASALSGN
ncbi:TPA: 1-acyl-sn-glycerol-3-phosphate acyltransferase, partial [Escherichia coli]